MQFSTHKNFFGIRTEINITDKIILGVLPILMVIFIWYIMTSGSSKIVTLPVGNFEGFEVSPKVGTTFKDKVRMTIENGIISYPDAKDDRMDDRDNVTHLEYKNEKFKVTGLPAMTRGKNAIITLPPGKIIGYIEPTNSTLQDEEPVDTASEEINDKNAEIEVAGSASLVRKPTSEQTSKLRLIAYKYEVVETRVFAPVILPSPSEVFSSLPQLWSARSLPKNILYSFLRVGSGFLTAFIFVFPISLLMGSFSKFKSLFAPLMLFSGYLPIPALVPLTMCLFGTNETQKIMFLAIGFAIYLLPLFVKAIDDVDNVYLHTGYTLGTSKYQTLNKILLPVAMPAMFDAMRLSFGVGWGYIILAEMVDMGSYGVGALILTSQRRGPREDIYLVLIAIVVMAFITDKIWEKCGDTLFPYRNHKR